MPLSITPAQRRFLARYLPDVLHGDNATLANATRVEFIQKVSAMDFDGAASSTDCRVARNLKLAGYLDDLSIRGNGYGEDCIYLSFSTAGAEALFEIMAKGH